LRLADLVEPDIGGQPRHAEHAECGGERCGGRIELEQALAGDGAIELPAVTAQHEVTLAEGGIAGARDLADDPPFHHGTDLDRPGIRPHAADAAAHIGVE
jgi:hypothetical protein